jgi:hypothetical protein
MLTKGGHIAKAGTYWNMVNGERVDLEQEGTLPGDERSRYIKAPAFLAVATGPALGLFFAVFLPFIAIAMALVLLGGKIIDGMVYAATSAVTFGWRPIESYLTGRLQKKTGRKRAGEDK